MKFTNRENRKKVCYISENDIKKLKLHGYHIPEEANGKTIGTKENYYRITDEKEIEYLMSLEFIVDYREAKKKTKEELLEEVALLEKKIRRNLTYCEEVPDEYIKDALEKLKEARLMEYQRDELLEVKLSKEGIHTFQLPEIIDNDALNLTMVSSNYTLHPYINNDIVLAVKKR